MNAHPTITNLQDGETVQMVIRRHWIVYMSTIGYIFILLISTSVLLAFKATLESVFPVGLLDVALVLYWAIFLIFIYITWTNNELDLIIITNKRVIGIDQISFLLRDFSECPLDRVQEINARTKGLLSSLFNFGTITIHTASEASDFIMHSTGDPLETAREGLNVVQRFKPQPASNDKSL